MIFNLNHKILIIIFGLIPATLWFVFGLTVSIMWWGDYVNYFMFTLFFLLTLMGTVGFWLIVLKVIENNTNKIIIIILFLSGIASMTLLYLEDPSIFRKLELTLLAPIVVGASVILRLMYSIRNKT